ncbi:phosphate ABC transporter substrate-binding protein PstS [Nodularia spumigena CS-584]|jgi:phosphate transport system substrate-binding protein|uniref:Phosphate-binding protein n=3 Tax=Nodularia spumigena TaxID=70799 RepID=A0A2S0Q9E1_NODSP|nr:phosphate ABC transporter substrate-binding protein PstS [Nodularia spumigena]AVZ31033.1 phosphate-binding protein PstS [Nodularia spumigena UHCC 0039]EAW46886.1 phosphate-binding periplasmic protein of phosphate ABC transporter [Nodularia spumigena CCY9414]MDB9383748.1 phosphate ABC transporter substrate-binding protein PstS [Nodularia spumigena CS-584]MEA5524790.1 phosphate ABC transporter substrate-binding protein PstS [Nodularia spumigena UHCC 0143]MEA5556113.1 phosphate ABC transporter
MLSRLHIIKKSRLAATASVLALTFGLGACGTEQVSETPGGTATDTTATTPVKLDLGGDVALTGAGASFPAPLFQSWFADLNKKYPNLRVNYQSVGSGAGVEQFTRGTVDFGASDVAMKDEEIQQVPQDKGVILLPVTAGGIVLAYNLPGVTELNLPRDLYVDIILGKVKTWNDPRMVAANPDANLPDQPIAWIHRSDGSGTTGVFTKHLAAISPEWKDKVGEGKTVDWPVGVGGKGNEGVTAQIKQTQGSMGYIEYGYAKQQNLSYAALENKAGKFVKYNDNSASQTLAAIQLPENLRAFVPDPEGDESYPIVSFSWILAYKNYADPVKAKAMEATIEYVLTEGQKISGELGYIPLPQAVVEKVAAAADQISPDYQISVSGSGSSASK